MYTVHINNPRTGPAFSTLFTNTLAYKVLCVLYLTTWIVGMSSMYQPNDASVLVYVCSNKKQQFYSKPVLCFI